LQKGPNSKQKKNPRCSQRGINTGLRQSEREEAEKTDLVHQHIA